MSYERLDSIALKFVQTEFVNHSFRLHVHSFRVFSFFTRFFLAYFSSQYYLVVSVDTSNYCTPFPLLNFCLSAKLLTLYVIRFSSGIENNPFVFYRLMPGSTAQTNKQHTFYLQQRPENGFTWADIKVNHPLDYETIKEYNLTIRVEVSVVAYSTRNRTYPEVNCGSR